ncbi:MAG: hypothetical protein KF800_13485 [Lysobacter sp.]|nr:hypothetical protein [Lysobacter sp.]
MKSYICTILFLLMGCASVNSYGKQNPRKAYVIYTGFSTVMSHSSDPFDVDLLRQVNPVVRQLDGEETAALFASLEKYRIGKATAAERKQMRTPVYLAVFREDRRKNPMLISNGCHVLNLETGDLYRLEAETAVSIIGVPVENYESRLCKAPGLGITLSPR